MTEDSASGNRWEPAPANRPTDPGPTEGAQPPADATAQTADTQVLESPAAPTGRSPRRRKGLLAGVAAALFLGGSAGGYALGHSTTGTSGPSGSDPLGHHSGPPGLGPDGSGPDDHDGPGRDPGEAPGFGTGDDGSSANGTGA